MTTNAPAAPHLKPQTRDVLDHLEKHGTITDGIAFSRLGIRRLGARVHELRRAGYEVQSRRTKVRGRHGAAHIAEYYLPA